MTLLCNDCFEEFESDKEVEFCGVCSKQKKIKKPKKFHNSDRTSDIWKLVHTRGFKSQEELDEYQIVKHDHKILTGNELRKVEEKIK